MVTTLGILTFLSFVVRGIKNRNFRKSVMTPRGVITLLRNPRMQTTVASDKFGKRQGAECRFTSILPALGGLMDIDIGVLRNPLLTLDVFGFCCLGRQKRNSHKSVMTPRGVITLLWENLDETGKCKQLIQKSSRWPGPICQLRAAESTQLANDV